MHTSFEFGLLTKCICLDQKKKHKTVQLIIKMSGFTREIEFINQTNISITNYQNFM
jgi:N12 class adenine-specific DNA methylase